MLQVPPVIRCAIIGAGPRGISVAERLLSHAAQTGQGVRVSLIDPHLAGPGKIWRTDQSEQYLMNTQSFFPTVVPDHGVGAESLTKLSFNQWRQQFRPEILWNEFPPRRCYGEYLRWTCEELARRLPENCQLEHIAAEAIDIHPDSQSSGHYRITLASGEYLDADAIVLAVGHVGAELNAQQQKFAQVAQQKGWMYQPPAFPATVDWDAFPAQERVLVRGLGLNFFDVMAQWTLGRGGKFTVDGYQPSGREPQIIAGSRRGLPYRAKALLSSYYPDVSLRFVEQEISRLVQLRESTGALAEFTRDLWPAIYKDATRAYYGALLADEGLIAALDQALADNEWRQKLRDWEQSILQERRFDLETVTHPFAKRNFADQAALQQVILAELETDIAGALAGAQDPYHLAIGVLNKARTVLKGFISNGGLSPESFWYELRGRFEPLVEGVASGPPVQRIQQLAALVRAGIVSFIGPEVEFDVGPEGFMAQSPRVGGAPIVAHAMVEAMSPPNIVAHSSSPLLRQLLADGLGRPATLADGTATAGLDVTRDSQGAYVLVNQAGKPVPGVYVLGLQLASVQWGTAIAAQANAEYPGGYQTLLDADRAAVSILKSDRVLSR